MAMTFNRAKTTFGKHVNGSLMTVHLMELVHGKAAKMRKEEAGQMHFAQPDVSRNSYTSIMRRLRQGVPLGLTIQQQRVPQPHSAGNCRLRAFQMGRSVNSLRQDNNLLWEQQEGWRNHQYIDYAAVGVDGDRQQDRKT